MVFLVTIYGSYQKCENSSDSPEMQAMRGTVDELRLPDKHAIHLI
jgi:hypothetical protein